MNQDYQKLLSTVIIASAIIIVFMFFFARACRNTGYEQGYRDGYEAALRGE